MQEPKCIKARRVHSTVVPRVDDIATCTAPPPHKLIENFDVPPTTAGSLCPPSPPVTCPPVSYILSLSLSLSFFLLGSRDYIHRPKGDSGPRSHAVEKREGVTPNLARDVISPTCNTGSVSHHLLELQAGHDSSNATSPARAVIPKGRPSRVVEHAHHGKLGAQL